MTESWTGSSVEEPYKPPEAPLVSPAPNGIRPAEEELLRAFVGPRADYYLKKWSSLDAGQKRGGGFNWAAFFLSVNWIAYRKMYKVYFIVAGILLATTVLEEVVFVGILRRPEVPGSFTNLLSFAAWFVCGACGNVWYRSHAEKVVAELKARTTSEEVALQQLRGRGGTSLGASLLLLLLFLLALFAIGTVLSLTLYTEQLP